MAKSNTGTKTAVITNQPVQTVQTIKVQPNGNKVIIEKDKSVVPTVTTKDKVRVDASGTPIADVAVTKTVKDKTTAITRTVINKQGEVVKQHVDINKGKNTVRVKVVTPYTSPDIKVVCPPPPSSPITSPTQYDQIISYPGVDDDGLVVPPHDTSGEDYVDVGSVASTANGALNAQTFRSPRDGYVTKIRFYLADVGANGDLVLNLCATQRTGEPDLAQVFASKTIAFADLKLGWNDVTLVPAFVQKGKLYAVNFLSTGNHTFLIAVGGNLSQGTFFTSQDQAWFKGLIDEDMALQIFYAEFTNLQTITTMEPLVLEGGIGAMQTRLFEIEPEGTKRTLQGRISGVWTDLASENVDYPFGNLPALLELRQVLSGTKDLMPATNHDVSRVITYRLRTDFKGVSKLLTAGASVTTAKVTVLMHNFKEADHDCVIKLLKADNTVITHATVSDTPTDDPLIIERTATFTFSALTQFRWLVEGATVSSLSTFGISEVRYQAA
jgi:hypothetical protein